MLAPEYVREEKDCLAMMFKHGGRELFVWVHNPRAANVADIWAGVSIPVGFSNKEHPVLGVLNPWRKKLGLSLVKSIGVLFDIPKVTEMNEAKEDRQPWEQDPDAWKGEE